MWYHMGKFVEDWDAQIMQIRTSYLQVIASRKTDLAVHFLEMMHCTLPPKARITDFEGYVMKKANYYFDELQDEQSEYCLHWAPLIETAISTHRDKALREMNG